MLRYSVRLASNYNGMVMATFPDVPEAMAFGRDHEEALEEAKRALEAALERYQAEGRPMPPARAGGALQVGTDRFGCLEEA